MSEIGYEDVLHQAQLLSPADQLRLMEKLAAHVREAVLTGDGRHILELRGLGKDVWRGIDVDNYLNEERNSSGWSDLFPHQ